MADRAAPAPLVVRFDYHFDRLLPAKLARAYELLVPDHRWPVSAPAAVAQETDHEHVRRDLRSRVVGSSA